MENLPGRKDALGHYDAFLLVSFGGPEGPDDVMPFLENVTRGRRIPRERLEAVAEHYYAFGGVSPINQQCRDLLAAIGKDFAAEGLNLPLYWGNRNWDPLLTDTVATMAADGVRRAIAFVTSAYGSYSSCRQYLEDIEKARAEVGAQAPVIDKIRHYFNHPGFVGPLAASTLTALGQLPPDVRSGAHLVFTAHSIPDAMAVASGPPEGGLGEGPGGGLGGEQSGEQSDEQSPGRPRTPENGRYVTQLTETARLVSEQVAAQAGEHHWRLAYQSRSGPPHQPWLGPDVCDYLEELAARGAPAAVLVPAGFVSDHMEVKHDLDLEAKSTAERLGLPVERAATPGTDPRFVHMITELVQERLGPRASDTGASGARASGAGASGPEDRDTGASGPGASGPGASGPGASDTGARAFLGHLGAACDTCPAGCCAPASGPASR